MGLNNCLHIYLCRGPTEATQKCGFLVAGVPRVSELPVAGAKN